jgi:hypothetical protein
MFGKRAIHLLVSIAIVGASISAAQAMAPAKKEETKKEKPVAVKGTVATPGPIGGRALPKKIMCKTEPCPR